LLKLKIDGVAQIIAQTGGYRCWRFSSLKHTVIIRRFAGILSILGVF